MEIEQLVSKLNRLSGITNEEWMSRFKKGSVKSWNSTIATGTEV
jgi:hypothetical protein